jgi:hypothetical protein
VLERVHALIEPTIHVKVREQAAEEGKPVGKVLAVVVADYGDPTCIRELGHFAETWGDVREWHGRMMMSGEEEWCDLDVFMRERLVQRVAVRFAGSG